jgi:hypothetical protein
MAKPIKKEAVKKIAPAEKLKVPTASEEYHAKKEAKEAKRYGGFGRGGAGKKEKRKARMAKIQAMTAKLRERRQSRSVMGSHLNPFKR